MYTPLHRALGREPGDLTYELLEACVDARVREAEDLDWKQQLPQRGKDRWQDEWAKDVAAMANSGGGVIVHGVVEEPGTSSAADLADVGALDETIENQLRQSAAALILPVVSRLQFVDVASSDGRHALVVRVPASPEVPHLLREGRHGYKAPFRYGATTEWMTDRDLERAYRHRIRRSTDLEDALRVLYASVNQSIERLLRTSDEGGIYVLAAAVPVEPQPELELSDEHAQERLRTAQDLEHPIAGVTRGAVFYDLNVAPGLRRLVSAGPPDDGQTALHFDGSVTRFEKLTNAGAEGRGPAVPSDELELALVRVVALLAATARTSGHLGNYAVMTGMRWADPAGLALRFAAFSNSTGRHRSMDRTLETIEPSIREVRADGDISALRSATSTLALDLLRQGGIARLTCI